MTRFYIVPVEDEERNLDTRYVGQIRSFPELIHCKDCTKYKHWECPIERAGYRPKEDGYCFDAERKTE